MMHAQLLPAFLLFSAAIVPQAVTRTGPVTKPTPVAAAPAPVSELIRVTIYPSRNEVVPSGSYGVYADLENISAFPVMILPSQTALVVLPEASEPSACVNWQPGIFPTETPIPEIAAPAPTLARTRWDNPLLIQRGEHYVVFWDLEPASEKRKGPFNGTCELPPHWLSALGFVPGDYAFTVEGNAYALEPAASTPINPSPAVSAQPATPGSVINAAHEIMLHQLVAKASTGELMAHHFSETKTLHVGLSQLTTLLAAMIGAFIAYWVIALKPGKDWDAFILTIYPDSTSKTTPPSTVHKILAGLSLVRNSVLAAVLGGVVTIVASRLSDTHFPVKVSVSDWWGALTIGFVSFFIGNKFIDSLSRLGGDTTDSTLGRAPNPPGNTPTPKNIPSPTQAAPVAATPDRASVIVATPVYPAQVYTPIEEDVTMLPYDSRVDHDEA